MTILPNIKIQNLNFLKNYGLNPYHWVEVSIKTTPHQLTLNLQNIEDPSMLLEAIIQKVENNLTLSSLSWII